MDVEKIKILIREYPTSSLVDISKKLKVHYSTLSRYVRNLRKNGVTMEKLARYTNHSDAQRAIDKAIGKKK